MNRALILKSIQQDNILPITSHCNSRCLFCSHLGNPPGIEVYSVGVREFAALSEDINFLNGERDIVIGESATRFIEGEPFLYPHIEKLLQEIRKQHPRAAVKLTTNGTLLTEERVRLLSHLGNFEINLSLNAVSDIWHKKLMGNTIPAHALNEGFWFKKFSIPFHGSIVAMPWITGWDEINKSLQYLEAIGALSVRVFMPGYSKYSPQSTKFDKELEKELYNYIAEVRNELSIPVLLEPPMLTDFLPQIAGVIKGSIADGKGIRRGDVILKVNGKEPISRVDAWKKVTASANPVITILRDNNSFDIVLNKTSNQKSGIVYDYDLNWDRTSSLKKLDSKATLIITSQLAYPLVSQIPHRLKLKNTYVKYAPNLTFGGSIACAGLLTLKDIEAVLFSEGALPENVVLPEEIFDYKGNDLFGQSYTALEEKHKVKVHII